MHYGRVLIVLATFAVAGSLLAGCAESLDMTRVEDRISEQFSAVAGQEPERVTCPDKLKARVDETVRCLVSTRDGAQVGAVVTVTDVSSVIVTYEVELEL